MGTLTDLLNTAALVYGKVQTAKYNAPTINQFPYGYGGPAGQITQGSITNAGFDIPFVDVVGTVGKEGLVWDPNANCGNGKWIKRRRRRRKVLVTNSEIAGLAKLKGVVGAGATMKEWIATHS